MTRRILHIAGTIGCLCFLWAAGAGHLQAQISPSAYDYPHRHLPWYTLESEHFLVHFQEGGSRAARVASRVAEEVYPHITRLYEQEPDSKVSIVLNDREDYSNGAAYFFDNMIQIWVPSLHTPFRGTHNWMRDVITHEFTHIVQLQASMKKGRKVPAVYLQWMSYEDVRRPDILYGYPNGILTHPFASVSVPAWLAEGAAQYQRKGWLYDTWDSHRDMLLRTSLLEGTFLSFEEMGIFASKNGLEREQVYNQGFAFTTYLVHRFGESILPRLSKAFAQSGVFTAEEALAIATDTSGTQLFNEWISDRKAFYREAVSGIRQTQSTTLADEGFLNVHPRRVPGSSRIAYISNKGRDDSRLALYIRNAESEEKQLVRINSGEARPFNDHCSYREEPLLTKVRPFYSFSPDGKRLAFTRRGLNSYGERYDDIFVYHLETGGERRLTRSRRISAPSWDPRGRRIAAIIREGGTQNLVLVDPTSGNIRRLTSYRDGEQLFTPAWHPGGEALYFAMGGNMGRNILRFHLSTGDMDTVLQAPYIDYRDPFIDESGTYLYYASDETGIFNIYRRPLAEPSGEAQQLTNVLGGAFMPFSGPDSTLLFSEYRSDGYRISSLPLESPRTAALTGSYDPVYPGMKRKPPSAELMALNRYDDADIDPLPDYRYRQADTARVELQLPGGEQQAFYEYRDTFTGLSFYPAVRFDNYSRPNGGNGKLIRSGRLGALGENLLRDLKIGTYISSRDVLGRLSLFGGALIGPASRSADGIGDFFSPSRLTDLDRDLFLVTEYRGLPLTDKRWAPTVSIELYNLRRNVEGGLAIEEFPCTSCLPDTLHTDVSYNIWEADLYLRSKINDRNLLEVGAGYTPYRVQTDGFFSRELQQYVPSSSTEYFKGAFFSIAHIFESFRAYRHGDIAPIGLRTHLRYAYEPGRLLDDFRVRDGSLIPVYTTSKNHSLEAGGRYGFRAAGRAAGQLTGRFYSYLNRPRDSFYLDYIGGFTGMRSYPFFALGGMTTAYGRFSYIFPLIRNINRQVGRYTLDKLYLRTFAEAGNTWDSPMHPDNGLRTGIGSEIRFAFNSYYLFPLKLFVSTAYGFNQFDVTLPEAFITDTPNGTVTYGRELLFHFGLTFDFNIPNHD